MTGRYCWRLAVVVTLWLSMEAGAQETGAGGVELGLRAGFQAGVGYVYRDGVSPTGEPRDLKITDAANGAIPVLLEAGYRVNRNLFLGVYGQYAYVLVKTNEQSCPEGFDCSVWQWSFGPEAVYHFSPGAGFDPWVGLGFGLEILRSEVSGTVPVPVPGVGTVPAETDVSVVDRGPELNLSVGGDLRLGQSLLVGPFLTVTLSQYTVRVGEQVVTLPGAEPRSSPLAPVGDGPHALFTLGVRLAFLP